jgi:predicted ribosomally synthesized peptide with SipW-like signal peptide
MVLSTRRRLALAGAAVATIGAVATLVAGVTFGLFSATESSGANTFTVGTVSVGLGTPASVTCNITSMMPGDSSAGAPIGSNADTTCTYNVKYTGTVGAYLGVDIAITDGSTALYDGTATGLQLYLKDGTPTTYVTSTAPTAGTTYKQEGGTPASLPATGVSDLLVSTTPAATNTAVDFSLDYALPIASTNAYQGGTATVTLTFHAVQSADNALPADCAAGQQCNAAGDGSSFAWS